MRILSTKILTETQKQIVADYEVLEVPMIEISYGEGFKIEEQIPFAVFTSGNSVKSVFGVHKNNKDLFHTVFCVGEKTKYLLEKQGVVVEAVANNALELAETLIAKFKDIQEISWFCGNLRNNDLPTLMAENGVLVTEYLVYQTTLISKKIEEELDALLFYSPSGIRSYLKQNKPTSVPVICIGTTTATEAVQSFENVYIADEQTVESVLLKTKEIGN
ncbi:uroporphyrinogen-III synthase [Wenyingzhuangia sp. IMCC45574]